MCGNLLQGVLNLFPGMVEIVIGRVEFAHIDSILMTCYERDLDRVINNWTPTGKEILTDNFGIRINRRMLGADMQCVVIMMLIE